ncbi:MAG: sulfotransferase [Hyphomicrobiales bacterium]|nr:sulfotransferase [Hyphomicrobiales bacterium]
MKNPFSIERVGGVSPYVWYGMRFGGWARLLAGGGFDVTLNCLPRILAVSAVTPLNSALYHALQLVFAHRVADTEVRPPVFIIGHWRTGTTLLHELLDADPGLAAPTSYQCMFPSTFLATQGLVGRWTKGMLPATRPFDNMSFGHDRPQEDEFALLNSGLGTPYATLAFPRHDPVGLRYVDLADLDETKRRRWEAGYLAVIRRFQLGHDRRLVLKSPVHAARIPTLLRLFPDARFIFTARDPFEIFTSHVRTVKVMAANQGLHNPIPANDSWVKAYVLDMFERLFDAYERDRDLIPSGRLAELRYEDLTVDPLGRLQALYRELDLGDFELARPSLAANLDERKGYKRNVHWIDDVDRAVVAERWGRYRERFGYPVHPA